MVLIEGRQEATRNHDTGRPAEATRSPGEPSEDATPAEIPAADQESQQGPREGPERHAGSAAGIMYHQKPRKAGEGREKAHRTRGEQKKMKYTTIRPEAAQEPPKQPRTGPEAQPRSYIRTPAAAPRRYTTVTPAAAQRGDVIIFESPEYDERITRGSWQKRFYMVREYMTITEQPSNNGTVKAKDKRGRKRCRHLSDPGIIEIRRPA